MVASKHKKKSQTQNQRQKHQQKKQHNKSVAEDSVKTDTHTPNDYSSSAPSETATWHDDHIDNDEKKSPFEIEHTSQSTHDQYNNINLRYFDFDETFVNISHITEMFKKNKANLYPQSIRYSYITSQPYLKRKFGAKRSSKIRDFVQCIHCKITTDVNVNRIKKFEKFQNAQNKTVVNDQKRLVVNSEEDKNNGQYKEILKDKNNGQYKEILKEENSCAGQDDQKEGEYIEKWKKMELFLLLVFLSQRGGPDYWCDQKPVKELDSGEEEEQEERSRVSVLVENDKSNNGDSLTTTNSNEIKKRHITLTEYIIKQNINKSYSEDSQNKSPSDVNYVYSSIWANFMEGLINHYMEERIIPKVEKEVCFHLYIPMVRIMILCHQYQMEQLVDDAELQDDDLDKQTENLMNMPVPKMITDKLQQLSDLYTSLNGDEQDFQLDEFVFSAEEYIETIYIPQLIAMLFEHIKFENEYVWDVLEVLKPFFYYIEDMDDDGDDEEEEEDDNGEWNTKSTYKTKSNFGNGNEDEEENLAKLKEKTDPRIFTLQRIFKIASQEHWF